MARKKRRRIGTIDCETDPFEAGVFVVPFLWGILLDDGSYFEFTDTNKLVEFIADFDGILYAHNGGKFDYHFLRDHIESDEIISVVAGRLARCKIGKCELRDSLNLFGQTRLADFSKKEIDYRKMRRGIRERPEVWNEIREYLKYDCESLFRLVSGFVDKYGMQFTQAGAAMKYWQKHHAPDKFIPQSTAGFYQTFQPFYYGGRVQCFASGHAREDFSVVDINSAYPYAMLSPHPYSTDFLETTRLPKNEAAIPQCLVTVDAIARGCFPLRDERDGSLFFPEDERVVRRYHITGWELVAALETNTVRIDRIVNCYQFGTPVSFRDYVTHFFEQRRIAKAASDKAQDIFAKIFLNALYGKFASNPTKYQEFMLSDPDSEQYKHWIASGYINAGEFGGRAMLVRPLPESKHRYYNVVTGASITGYVRAHLWRALNSVSGPLYCDTDSIAARDVARIDKGDALGQWKLEMECDEYAIAGKKFYAFHKKGAERELYVKRQMPLDATDEQRDKWEEKRKHWKVACKGADLTPGEIIACSTGGEFKYRNPVPNYSIHRNDFSFIDRTMKMTYRDISRYGETH